MERIRFFLLILSLLFIFAASPNQKKLVERLTRDLGLLEKNLGLKNKKYIKLVEKRESIEEKIFTLRNKMMAQERKIKKQIKKVKSLLGVMLVSHMDERGELENLLTQKILKKNLEERLKSLKEKLKKNKEFGKKVEMLSVRWKEYSSLEKELASLIDRMEQEKNMTAHQYLKERRIYQENLRKKRKQRTQREREKGKLAKRKEKPRLKVNQQLGFFSSPLKDYKFIEHNKKGVTYLYQRAQPIRATRKGRILHSGKLSTFGHVIVIDHGQDIRSILFGSFESKVKKGIYVKEKDLIAHTLDSIESSGELYFEVRRKNVIQNTINLLKSKWAEEKDSLLSRR